MNFINQKNIINALRSLVDPEYGDRVCLDIGTAFVKALYKKDNVIKKYFLQKNNGTPVTLLANWLKEQNLINKPIRLSIKGQDTLIRYLPFPKVEKNKLKQTIEFSLGQLIPFNKDQIYYDVALIKEDFSPKEFFILLAVTKKNYVEEIVKNFAQEGVNIKEITLNSLALINLGLSWFNNNENIILVDIGASSMLINLINKGVPLLSREIKISPENLFKNIAKEKNISLELVSNWLIECKDKSDIYKLGEDFFMEIVDELKSSIDYFQLNNKDKINAIYLSGGFAKLNDLGVFLNKHLGIEVKAINLPQEVLANCNKDILESKELLATVMGLSL